jgi:peptidoglycan/xylan/chitin deacetylase (PgdA/CDA1 family)
MRALSSRLPPLALAYHGVVDLQDRPDPHALFVQPRALARHIRRLQQWGYTLVTLRRLAELAATRGAAGFAAITFDDGFQDNLAVGMPLLHELGVPATVFVVTSWLGGRHPEAAWAPILAREDVRSLHAAGWEIGSHTRTHADLSKLPYEAARDELVSSRAELEEMVGDRIVSVSYPWGRINAETARAARGAGYSVGCRISGEGDWNDPLNLPRQDMEPDATLLDLRLKRADRYESLMRNPTVRAAWRLGRLARRR